MSSTRFSPSTMPLMLPPAARSITGNVRVDMMSPSAITSLPRKCTSESPSLWAAGTLISWMPSPLKNWLSL